MSGSTGYNFAANTKARASEVNLNFEWFRGHYLPVTQSGTWANTTGVYDLGSSSFAFRNLYLTGQIIGGGVTTTSTEIAGATTGASGTTITTLNLGTVVSGYRVFINMMARCRTDTSTDIPIFEISRSSGLGNITFGHSSAAFNCIFNAATVSGVDVFEYTRSCIGRISSSGSLVLGMISRSGAIGAGDVTSGTSLYVTVAPPL